MNIGWNRFIEKYYGRVSYKRVKYSIDACLEYNAKEGIDYTWGFHEDTGIWIGRPTDQIDRHEPDYTDYWFQEEGLSPEMIPMPCNKKGEDLTTEITLDDFHDFQSIVSWLKDEMHKNAFTIRFKNEWAMAQEFYQPFRRANYEGKLTMTGCWIAWKEWLAALRRVDEEAHLEWHPLMDQEFAKYAYIVLWMMYSKVLEHIFYKRAPFSNLKTNHFNLNPTLKEQSVKLPEYVWTNKNGLIRPKNKSFLPKR